jgi:hypothetical protein
MYAAQGALMAELFPTRRRYSGASIAYQATSILAGLAVTLIAVLAAREARGTDLRAVQ